MINIELVNTKTRSFSLTALLSGHQHFLDKRFMTDTPECRAVVNQIIDYAEQVGITGGKQFGPAGTSAANLAVNAREGTLIEITPRGLCAMPPSILKEILENHKVILSDFYESGLFFTGMIQGSDPDRADILKLIRSENIKPRELYLLGSDYLMRDLPEHNIYQLRSNFWPLFVVLSSNSLLRTILDPKFRNSQTQIIREKHKKFGIFLNRKARMNRIELLDNLDKRELLDHMDWSLWYDPTGQHQSTTHVTNNAAEWITDNSNPEIAGFLRRHRLPRILGEIGDTDGQAVAFTAHSTDNYLGRYHYNVVAETHSVACNAGSFGHFSHVTEKTYKAFYAGAMPLILGSQNMEKHLAQQGFVLTDNGYDSCDGSARVRLMAEHIQQLHSEKITHTDACVENFLCATDPDWISGQIITPLIMINNQPS